MTAAKPLSTTARSASSRRLGNEQVAPPEEPQARPRTRDELVAALEDLYRESREFSETLEPIIQRYIEWIQDDAEVNEEDQGEEEVDIPQEIYGPYDEAAPAIVRMLADHAALVAQWDAAGMPDELPHHGLPAGSHLAIQFQAQRPEPPAVHRARLIGQFTVLEARAQTHMAQGRRLDELTGPDDPSDELIDGLLALERSYSELFHHRLALLREWDGAGFGQAVPPHGLEPVAGFHFESFEALDQQRLTAIRAFADR